MKKRQADGHTKSWCQQVWAPGWGNCKPQEAWCVYYLELNRVGGGIMAGFVVYGWVKETGLADLQEQSDPVGEQSSCRNLGGDTVDISAHTFNIHT